MARVARGVPGNIGVPNPFERRTLERAVSGKRILITGASAGIGEALAYQVGAAGGSVLLVARTREKLEEVARRIGDAGGEAHVHPADLSDLDDVERMAGEVLAEHGGVDVLVNNAGRSIRRSVALSYERMHDYQRTIELNYYAPVKLVLMFLPGMRDRQSGHIVNVSTMGVQTNVPRFSAYVASKAALDAFSRSIASEIVEDRVAISTVYMPLVRTEMIAPTDHYKYFPALSPEEAADMVAGAIAKRQKKASTTLGRMSEVTYATVPRVQDAVVNAGYKLFPDTKAAQTPRLPHEGSDPAAGARGSDPEVGGEGSDPSGGAESGTAEQKTFARVTRGVHW
ncbi:MAG: SDR family NAD(P)-dependent oxidoreductase [Solirubrobacterales bacterium]